MQDSYINPDREVARAEFADYLSVDADLRRLMAEFGQPVPRHKSLREFIFNNGKFHDGGLFVLPDSIARPLSQECYYNAWTYMAGRHDLSYCEGYAYLPSCPIPVLHGWCIDADGRIHDPSVEQNSQGFYYGVIFARSFSDLQWSRLRSHGLIGILGNWGYLDLNEEDVINGLQK